MATKELSKDMDEPCKVLTQLTLALEDIAVGHHVDAEIGALAMVGRAIQDSGNKIATGLESIAGGLHEIAEAIRAKS